MSFETIIALIGYAFVASITPGPNNFMLLASGVNFGFVRSIPHCLGISVGFFALLIGVGFGLGALLTTYPEFHFVLKIAGGSYLLYLAWQIGMSRSIGNDEVQSNQPMTFLQAAAFQWVNPKAWIMAVTSMTIYTNIERPFLSVILVSVIFVMVNLPCISIWSGCGVALRRFLSDPLRLKWFNISMGILLVLCLWPLLS